MNRALVDALLRYRQTDHAEAMSPLLDFVSKYRTPTWSASLLANIGLVYRSTGRWSQALRAWDEAWRLAKDQPGDNARQVADLALGEWLDLSLKFGDTAGIEQHLAAAQDRDVRGTAGAKLRQARQGLAILKYAHHEAVSSGPLALETLIAARDGMRYRRPPVLARFHPTPAGVTLPELAALATNAGLRMQMARRTIGAEVVVPSIVHWKVGHYSAIVDRDADHYLVHDTILGGRFWVSRQVLDEEGSGFALIPAGGTDTGWRVADAVQAQSIVGHCAPGGPGPDDPCPCVTGGAGGPGGGGPPGAPPSGGGPTGMPRYTFHPVQTAVVLLDTPVGYAAPVGPAALFRLSYNHWDTVHPQSFTFSNLGPLWTFDWLSYVSDDPTYLGQPVHVVLRGSGREWFSLPDANGVYPAHWRSRAVLVRTSTNPIRYERRLRDGSVEVFGQSDGLTVPGRRIFLTELIDARGQHLAFTYDSSFRMVAATDALGQVTTLSYEDASDPLKITKVTDPFGRFATLTYDSAGQLSAITDVIGLTTTFTYAANDFVSAMTTPYGTTAFRHEPNQILTQSARWVEATDPLGGTERLEWRWSTTAVSATVPSSQVPTGFDPYNDNLDHYNTFYWSKLAMARGGTDAQAVVTHYLLSYAVLGDHGTTSTVPHSIKRPLESRVWYAYPDQHPTAPRAVGSWVQPTAIARVLDDGTSQVWQATYNDHGMALSRTDPRGRRTSFTYAANGIDLTDIRQTTGSLNDLVASYSGHTAQHLPTSMTDAAGQTTAVTYNALGQVLTVTNPKNEVTTNGYDSAGYLQSVTGPIAGATTSYTYDGYGRPRTVTDSDGYTVTTDYDALDRPTRVTYPDGTYEDTTYDKLDAVGRRDRLGRWTRLTVDPLQRVVATRDPLGRTVTQHWCTCGALDALVDAKGQRTSWERDIQARVVEEVRADGVTATSYTYEPATGRLQTVTDPKGQVTTYAYFVDDAIASLSWSNAAVATPSVSFTYDVGYPRTATMADGTGTTSYTYGAAGTPGAGQIATVDGPLDDDTIVYAYDELGRVSSRTIGGVGVDMTYDALGRVTEETNALGTFTYGYDGESARLALLTYPNGQMSSYSYLPTAQDHRLQTIHHKYPTGATLSKFDYTYDAVGNMRTWRQQADSDPPVEWTYGYDAADQLTRAIKRTTDTPATILSRYAYRYDPAGNRLSEQVDDTVVSATYDSLNRLLTQSPGGVVRVAGTVNEPATVTIDGQPATVDGAQAFAGSAAVAPGTTTFSVVAADASGNSTTAAFQVAQAGSGKTFTFDANGNLTADGMRTFEWDARNQLVAVNVGTHRSEFTYDGQQRRIRVIEKENSVVHSDTKVVWCDTAICEERAADGTTVTRRAFPQGEQISGASRYFTTDHLGSVTEVTDGSASVLARYAFDPWGRRSVTAGADVSSVGYAGYRSHSSSSLALTLYRGYDAESARWLNHDPIGLQGGSNLFRYAENNPVRFNDPLGLAIWICTRYAWRGSFMEGYGGNHSYFWDDRNGKCCGRGSTSSCSERGPGKDSCRKIADSDGKEDELMKCCKSTADWGPWFPPVNDCHEALDDCLRNSKLKNPGAPGGRVGPPCDPCDKKK